MSATVRAIGDEYFFLTSKRAADDVCKTGALHARLYAVRGYACVCVWMGVVVVRARCVCMYVCMYVCVCGGESAGTSARARVYLPASSVSVR